MTDPISDMLNRIKNASAMHHETVRVPHSSMRANLAQLLAREGLLLSVDQKKKGNKEYLILELRYENNSSLIRGVKRVSRPGRRMYAQAKNVKAVKFGYGLAVISTPKGLMTDKEARRAHLGGEVVCEVW